MAQNRMFIVLKIITINMLARLTEILKGISIIIFFFFRHAQFFPLSFKLHNVHLKTLYVSTQVNVTVWSSSVSDEKF